MKKILLELFTERWSKLNERSQQRGKQSEASGPAGQAQAPNRSPADCVQ